MTLFNRIKFTNTCTFGTMHDRNIQLRTYGWIGQDVPDNAYFFCTYINNAIGVTSTCEVVIEINGVSKGPFDIFGQTTCQEALAEF